MPGATERLQHTSTMPSARFLDFHASNKIAALVAARACPISYHSLPGVALSAPEAIGPLAAACKQAGQLQPRCDAITDEHVAQAYLLHPPPPPRITVPPPPAPIIMFEVFLGKTSGYVLGWIRMLSMQLPLSQQCVHTAVFLVPSTTSRHRFVAIRP